MLVKPPNAGIAEEYASAAVGLQPMLVRIDHDGVGLIDCFVSSSLRFVQELEEGGKETVRRFEIYPDRAVFVQTSKQPAKEEKSRGLMLGFHMPVAFAASIGPRTQSTTTAVGTEINAWIVIDKDGTVTLRIPHTEQGQGYAQPARG